MLPAKLASDSQRLREAEDKPDLHQLFNLERNLENNSPSILSVVWCAHVLVPQLQTLKIKSKPKPDVVVLCSVKAA